MSSFHDLIADISFRICLHCLISSGSDRVLLPAAAAPAFYELDYPVTRLCGADLPMPYAKSLEEASLPTAADVANAVKKALNVS